MESKMKRQQTEKNY